jgi:hypothetical protein
MPNSNADPAAARAAKRAKRTHALGDLPAMRRKLWQAVVTAEEAMLRAADAGDTAGALRGVHALTQASGAFVRIVEAGEVEPRLAELERKIREATEAGVRPLPHHYAD